MLPDKTQKAVDLACEKGTSNWLTVIPLKDMDFDLNKPELFFCGLWKKILKNRKNSEPAEI